MKPTERRALRARAHHLHPVVSIGQHGLTAQVLHEIDLALTAHELVKVRVFNDVRAEREVMLADVCARTGCAPVQHLGKLLILWRPQPAPEKDAKRAAKAVQRASGKPGAKTARGTTKRKPVGSGAPAEPRPTGTRVPRRARGQPLDSVDDRAPARPPRSTKPARGTPSSPKSPRGKGRSARPEPAQDQGFVSATRKSPKAAPPATGRRTVGGPAGLPRAPNPRRRRAQSR